MKILVVEDDEAFSALVQTALAEQHYQIDSVADAQSGWDWLEAYEYDLILLDLILPGEADGLSFCRALRAKGNLTPVLLMTANEAQSVKVQGLDAGADDYLVKPFDWEELRARVRALLRRGQDSLLPLLTWGGLELDPSSCEVVCVEAVSCASGGRESLRRALALTAKEYSLLELLLRNPQRIFSASALLDRLWDCDDAPSENAVRAHVKGLRRKLKQAEVGDPIETVYGLGYRLREEPCLPESSVLSQDATAAEMATPLASPQESSVYHELERVWQRARQTYLTQVMALDSMLVERSLSGLGAADWSLLRRQAHSLKGGLGSFGLHGAAAVAAQLQELVAANALSEDPLRRIGQPLTLSPPSATSTITSTIQTLLAQLRQALEEAATLQLTPLVGAPNLSDVDESIGLCWLVTTDNLVVRRLGGERNRAIAVHGMTLEILAPEDFLERYVWFREQAQDQPESGGLDPEDGALPQVVLWDCLLGLEEFNAEHLGGLSWIALVEGESLTQRIQAVQGGCCGCLDRESSRYEILEAVSAQLQHRTQQRLCLEGAKLLVVDDDPVLLSFLENLLLPWGVKLTLLAQAEQFWQVLQATSPDLLLLDVEMPSFNGVDLCQVVRQASPWRQLPIVFLSAHHDGPLLEALFAAGADDFLHKPVTEQRLVERLCHWLSR